MASSSTPTMPSVSGTASAATTASSSSGSPCAACKFLRRKCQPDCVFAPYFPPDSPHKFVHVHRVFGASNVSKLLHELHPCQREDAVNSLAYEADMRLRDPVYGCVGIISILQRQLRHLQAELSRANADLQAAKSAAAAAAKSAAAAAVRSCAAAAAGASAANFVEGSAAVHTQVSAAAGSRGFSNVNRSMGMTGITFGQDQLFQGVTSRNVSHHDDMIMMSRNNYDVELAVRFGANGAYNTEIAAYGATAEAMGPFGGQFMKPNMDGGDDQSGMGPL